LRPWTLGEGVRVLRSHFDNIAGLFWRKLCLFINLKETQGYQFYRRLRARSRASRADFFAWGLAVIIRLEEENQYVIVFRGLYVFLDPIEIFF